MATETHSSLLWVTERAKKKKKKGEGERERKVA